MKFIGVCLLPMMLFGVDIGLKELIDQAYIHNQDLKSKSFDIQHEQKKLDAEKSAYWPVLELSTSYRVRDPFKDRDRETYIPKEVLSGNAYLTAELYDGGRKRSLVKSEAYQLQSSVLNRRSYGKNMALRIIEIYYSIKTEKDDLKLFKRFSREVETQIERLQQFADMTMLLNNSISFNDDIDRLRITHDKLNYLIEATQLNIFSDKEDLVQLTGINVHKFKDNSIIEPRSVQFELGEDTKILKNAAASAQEIARSIDAGYLPQVDLQYSYSKSDYDMIPSQGNLLALVSLKLFDGGRIKNESEAAHYKKMSYSAQAIYSEQEQRKTFKVAYRTLKVFRKKLRITKNALKNAASNYKSIVEKYESGFTGYLAYLDALDRLQIFQREYNSLRYDYEKTKAYYYMAAGKDPKYYIK